MNIYDFKKYKEARRKITFITCYDYSLSKIVDSTDVDCILVGDSVAMTMHGMHDTLHADIDMMALHTKAVANGLTKKFLVADLPFMSYRGSIDMLNSSVMKLMKAGANAIKLEGVNGNQSYIKHLVESGVPVMGHIGLTPQFINTLGGYKVQGKTDESANLLLEQALELEKAGCFSIVLECVPINVADKITNSLTIPTIGIGAGNKTDGQILVIQDMLGLNTDFTPKFVKEYMSGYNSIQTAINTYCEEVQSSRFPCAKFSYKSQPAINTSHTATICNSIDEIQQHLNKKDKKTSIGFVPTMGNLHDGHASLISESIKNNDITVLSIFVNHTQFDNKDDLDNYPRTLDADIQLANNLGVDYIFLPTSNDMYHETFDFKLICKSAFAKECEGVRDGHFDGVLTVVLKLLNIIKADNAYFGKKDYQQYTLVKEMAAAFFLDTNIIACETKRLNSGLAMSSRNNRLSDIGITLASKVSSMIRDTTDILSVQQSIHQLPGVDLIYIEDIYNTRLYAFVVEGVRLIDNYKLA